MMTKILLKSMLGWTRFLRGSWIQSAIARSILYCITYGTVISIDETTGLARRRKERKIELEKAEAEMHENFSKLVSDISRDMEKETTDKLNKMVDQAVADWDKIVDDFKMESDEIVINFKEAMKKKNKDFDPTFYDLDSIVKED